MSRVLLSGNEAVAQGAWEAGAAVGVGYPGTPSTETLERFSKLPAVYAEWAPNEKVALEVAAGVSLAGKRVLVTMKHVGLNVAADPLFTLAYTGVNGGLVILVADDPGNALLAKRAGLPQLRCVRPGADARSFGLGRGSGLHQRGVRALGAIRYARARALHRSRFARQVARRDGRARGGAGFRAPTRPIPRSG